MAGTYPNPTIAAGAVGSTQLASGAVPHDGTGSDGSTKLSTNSVNYNEIGPNAVRGPTFKASGSFTFDFPNVTSQNCGSTTINLGASNVDSNDVILVSATLGNAVTVTAFNTSSAGFFQLQLCNESPFSLDPPSNTFNYVVIDI